MALALQRATPAQRGVLEQVGRSTLSAADIAAVQQAIVDSGALNEMESTITRLTDEAISAIKQAPVSTEVKDRLIELAHFVSDRRV
jgi:geranylgeranyl diphosphate synthase type I